MKEETDEYQKVNTDECLNQYGRVLTEDTGEYQKFKHERVFRNGHGRVFRNGHGRVFRNGHRRVFERLTQMSVWGPTHMSVWGPTQTSAGFGLGVLILLGIEKMKVTRWGFGNDVLL